MDGDESATSLLDLPDPCLLAVLQYCAADNNCCTLFNAARANSRLHQAAVAVLHSIAANVPQQRDALRVMLYLERHGEFISSLHLNGNDRSTVSIRRLPPNLQLSSLQLDYMCLQLSARRRKRRFPGVLGSAGVAALTKLQFSHCQLLDDTEGLTAALTQLAASLEHLSIRHTVFNDATQQFPTTALQQLQQLTYLHLAFISGKPSLQSLQALTGLVELRLAGFDAISASMLSHKPYLTHLHVSSSFLEPQGLAGNPQLQCLTLEGCKLLGADGWADEWADVEQLLSQLQHLQQLTHLSTPGVLRRTPWVPQQGAIDESAAAYAALTASSKLQSLDISGSKLPAGVWRYIFPTGRQLPHLTSLYITAIKDPSHRDAPAPEGSRLVSCCPSLRVLDMQLLQYGTELLPLQALSGLHTLHLASRSLSGADFMLDVCQLTRLRQLCMLCSGSAEDLLQLSHLQQLTKLEYHGRVDGAFRKHHMTCQAPADEPVWRQWLRWILQQP